jgi:hypothetical protein
MYRRSEMEMLDIEHMVENLLILIPVIVLFQPRRYYPKMRWHHAERSSADARL